MKAFSKQARLTQNSFDLREKTMKFKKNKILLVLWSPALHLSVKQIMDKSVDPVKNLQRWHYKINLHTHTFFLTNTIQPNDFCLTFGEKEGRVCVAAVDWLPSFFIFFGLCLKKKDDWDFDKGSTNMFCSFQ